MLKKYIPIISVSAWLMMSISPVFASGSDGSGAGAQTGEARLYNQGKGVYAHKIACDSCPMAGKTLDKNLAMELLGNPSVPSLSQDEKSALDVYLKRRFKL